jgi:hypothetical protein
MMPTAGFIVAPTKRSGIIGGVRDRASEAALARQSSRSR